MNLINKKVFISSTVYDLQEVRNSLKAYFENKKIHNVNFQPVMSEYPGTFLHNENDFIDKHSYDVCIEKIKKCDYFILLIYKRYNLQPSTGYNISITNAEFREAVKRRIPTFIFININTLEAYRLNKQGMKQNYIDSKHVQIFDFINEVNSRVRGNWRFEYNTPDDILSTVEGLITGFDNSIFIDEYPNDGEVIQKGTSIEHRWTIKNNGNVRWVGRYLDPINASVFNLDRKKLVIPISDIYPGQEFDAYIKFNTPYLEGNITLTWKMKNSDGTFTFPDKQGLELHFVLVRAV